MDQLVELSSRQLEKVGKFELENRPLALPVVLLNLLPQDISQASLGNDVLHLVNGMVANTRHLPRVLGKLGPGQLGPGQLGPG